MTKENKNILRLMRFIRDNKNCEIFKFSQGKYDLNSFGKDFKIAKKETGLSDKKLKETFKKLNERNFLVRDTKGMLSFTISGFSQLEILQKQRQQKKLDKTEWIKNLIQWIIQAVKN